jgi:hypothetical protein
MVWTVGNEMLNSLGGFAVEVLSKIYLSVLGIEMMASYVLYPFRNSCREQANLNLMSTMLLNDGKDLNE